MAKPLFGDYMVRATAANGMIRAFAATTKNTVEVARFSHNTSPVVTAALGRLLTGAAMMGSTMKNDTDLMTVQIRCDGPVEGLTVTADANGNVKGYALEPIVMIPAKENGKLDVGAAVGNGFLHVIKDLGLKEPYVGETELQTGEIAEDLTYYYAVSEQVPSVISLGVYVDGDNVVKYAGGFMIQLMPDATDDVIDILEAQIAGVPAYTKMLEEGMTPESILNMILEPLGLDILDYMPVKFSCNCSKDRVSRALAGIAPRDMMSLIEEKETIEVKCHFCNKGYKFSPDELQEILDEALKPIMETAARIEQELEEEE